MLAAVFKFSWDKTRQITNLVLGRLSNIKCSKICPCFLKSNTDIFNVEVWEHIFRAPGTFKQYFSQLKKPTFFQQGCKCILAFLVIVVIIAALLLILNWKWVFFVYSFPQNLIFSVFSIGTWTTLIIHAILLLGVIACAGALFLAMKTEKENLLLPVAGIAVSWSVIQHFNLKNRC